MMYKKLQVEENAFTRHEEMKRLKLKAKRKVYNDKKELNSVKTNKSTKTKKPFFKYEELSKIKADDNDTFNEEEYMRQKDYNQ